MEELSLATKTMSSEQDRCVLASEQIGSLKTEFIFSAQKQNSLTDVTLMCEDGELKAHRIILSSSSKFFDRVFSRNLRENPVIYMKGFGVQKLRLIIEFVYLGRTEVEADNLGSLLTEMKDLEIVGLSHDAEKSVDKYSSLNSELNDFEEGESGEIKSSQPGAFLSIKPEPNSAVIKEESDEEFSDVDYKVIKKPRKLTTIREKCGVEKSADGSYSCKQCSKRFANPGSLTNHVLNIHEGIRYQCSYCSHQSGQVGNAKSHQRTHHPGLEIRYIQVQAVEANIRMVSTFVAK